MSWESVFQGLLFLRHKKPRLRSFTDMSPSPVVQRDAGQGSTSPSLISSCVRRRRNLLHEGTASRVAGTLPASYLPLPFQSLAASPCLRGLGWRQRSRGLAELGTHLGNLEGLSFHSRSLAIDCCNTCNFCFFKKKAQHSIS